MLCSMAREGKYDKISINKMFAMVLLLMIANNCFCCLCVIERMTLYKYTGIHRHTYVYPQPHQPCFTLQLVYSGKENARSKRKSGAYSKNRLFQSFAVYVRPSSLLVSGYCTVLKNKFYIYILPYCFVKPKKKKATHICKNEM